MLDKRGSRNQQSAEGNGAVVRRLVGPDLPVVAPTVILDLMSEVTRILGDIERGEPSVAERSLLQRFDRAGCTKIVRPDRLLFVLIVLGKGMHNSG
jgi:hypothetical protein